VSRLNLEGLLRKYAMTFDIHLRREPSSAAVHSRTV
jgi:hypothetical protein